MVSHALVIYDHVAGLWVLLRQEAVHGSVDQALVDGRDVEAAVLIEGLAHNLLLGLVLVQLREGSGLLQVDVRADWILLFLTILREG